MFYYSFEKPFQASLYSLKSRNSGSTEDGSIRSLIKAAQRKKKDELDNFHRNTLLSSLKLTSFKNSNASSQFVCHSDRLISNVSESCNLTNLKSSLSCLKSQGVREWKEETINISRMNYYAKILRETKERNEEDIEWDLEENLEKIQTSKANNILFEDFLAKLKKILRVLNSERESEIHNLVVLKDTIGHLKKEILDLTYKKEKLVNEENKLQSYKHFLTCLKQRRLKPSISNKDSLNIEIKSRKTSTLKFVKGFARKNAMKKKGTTDILGLVSTAKKMSGFAEGLNIPRENLVYEHSDQILSDLNSLYDSVFDYLSVYEKNKEIINDMNKKTPKIINDAGKISDLENDLNDLKAQNQILIERKAILSSEKAFSKISLNIKLHIDEIYRKLNSEKLKMVAHKVIPLYKKFSIDENESMSYKLKFIEEYINSLKREYDRFSLDPKLKDYLYDMEKRLEKQKKINMIKLKEFNSKEKNEIKMKLLKIKHDKIVFRGRKIMKRFIKDKAFSNDPKRKKLISLADEFDNLFL
jgi:hypothetical protein